MIRRLSVVWPTPLPGRPLDQRPIRLLAVSDATEPAFADERNRAALGPIDGVLGAGDLEPDYLGFLADAFSVPLLYVRGNHDRGANWSARRLHAPHPLTSRSEDLVGIAVAGLSWPAETRGRAVRDEISAWRQALGLAGRAKIGRTPQIVVSHVPPRGLGDTPADPYHTGFAAYRWLCRRLHPVLWLHGHTSTAATQQWRIAWGPTTLVNVTGAVLIELAGAQTNDATIGQ